MHDKVSLGFGKVMLEANQWALQHASEFPLPLLLMHGTADAHRVPVWQRGVRRGVWAARPSWSSGMACIMKLIMSLEKAEVFKMTIQWMDEQLKQEVGSAVLRQSLPREAEAPAKCLILLLDKSG